MDVSPFDATLGAEVRGVDVSRPLEAAVFTDLVRAWHQYAVLILPGQHLDNEAQAAFSRRFGPLENVAIFSREEEGTVSNEQPIFGIVSNLGKDGSLAKEDSDRDFLLRGNTHWHTDSSFKRVPAKASLLSAKTVPSAGGETEFADMRAAYDALESNRKEWLRDKRAVHSYRYSQGLLGGGMSILDSDRLPPVEHPIVAKHPITGRNNLYLGRHASHIVGEDEDESRSLLDELCEEACVEPRTYKHRWAEGDFIIWDNRCVLHRGRRWPLDQKRVMVRTTVAGDAPDNEWAFDTDQGLNYST
jgi:alpha-ketoglutarate-dependent 2,4-dichlorophenoxyacetate dioxygenase